MEKSIILVFYPVNFIAISPTELIQLSEKISEFLKLSTQILAILVHSPFYHLQYLLSKSIQSGLGKLNFP